MFHVKHFSSGKCSSVLSPPPGENKRGGCTSGMKYDVKHEEKGYHSADFLFLTKWYKVLR